MTIVVINTASPEYNPAGMLCRKPPAFVNSFDTDVDGVLLSSKQPTGTSLLLSNVVLMEAAGDEKADMAILIRDGKIVQVGKTGTITYDATTTTTVDAQGRYATPGLVDMHSHLGLYSFPQLRGNADGNEWAQTPAAQMMRAVDALNPNDPAIAQMRDGGVTTALVMPGSANVIGGEVIHVKTKGGTVANMIVRGAPRGLKMACGENPKRVYGSRGLLPSSRMGNAWVMRQKLEEAKALRQLQDEWDCNPDNKDKDARKYRPSSLELEPLVGLLRGQNIVLNVHCYEVEDLEMVIRLSKEFKFKIDAFHHALEAYKIPDLIAKYNITIATFPDLWGYKVEAYDASVKAAKILREKGVSVAFKSDHPVTHAKDLLFNAGKGFYYGLDAGSALDSVTTVPARTIGLGNRIGRIQSGYDGDVVIWDRHPLLLGATPYRVVIEGVITTQTNLAKRDGKPNKNPVDLKSSVTTTCVGSRKLQNYVISNAKVFTMDATNTIISGANIVVTNGNVTCVDTSCPIPLGFEVFTQTDGVVIPGMIESSTALGLVEIQSEPDTNDGSSTGIVSGHAVFSKDGIRVQSRTVSAAWKGGVTTSVSHRTSTSVVGGVSSAFYTTGTVITDSLLKDAIAIQINLGSQVNDVPSVSAQIAYIRAQIQRALPQIAVPNSDDPWVQLLQLKIPMVVIAHQADDIGHILALQQVNNFKLIIVGGAEAYLIANKLANQLVSVVLTPHAEEQEPMSQYTTLRATNDYGAAVLRQAGVRVAIGTGSVYDVRNLRWIAGMVSTLGAGQLSEVDAIASVTKNVADIFELTRFAPGAGRIQTGTTANLVLFDGNPLTFDGRPKLVALGSTLECNPEQL